MQAFDHRLFGIWDCDKAFVTALLHKDYYCFNCFGRKKEEKMEILSAMDLELVDLLPK